MKVHLCTWNVRGLNDPIKLSEVKNFLNKNNIQIIALIETRVQIHHFPNLVDTRLGRPIRLVVRRAESGLDGF